MDYGLPGSSVHDISQARILEWVAISFFRGSSSLVIESGSPALQADSLPAELPGKPTLTPDVPAIQKSREVHKIAERNINNLRYADDTTLMAES